MKYEELILRNAGYISPPAQQKIRNTRLLIAGCGIGSSFAESAVRMGYEKLILVDHDTVDAHNLNRQAYVESDIKKLKVESLARRLKDINPNVQVEQIAEKVSPENAIAITQKADVVFDTIDFLDLPGLVALHDACAEQKKHLITAINAGYGAAGLYFPENRRCTIRDLFELPEGSLEGISYAERYGNFVKKIAHLMDPMVVEQFFKIMVLLSEGKPCPAPQVSPGAAAVAALAGTVAVRIAEGLPIAEAPDLLMINMSEIVTRKISF